MKLNFFQKIFFFLNLIAIFSLLLSYLAPFVSPQKFWMISFFGIGYPLLVLTNFLFFIFWLLQKKWVTVISLLTIIGGYKFLNKHFAVNFQKDKTSQNNSSIKIISYNVKNFNLYEWSTNKKEREKFLDLLSKENPDILCLQEFYTNEKGYFQNIQKIKELMSFPFHSFEPFQSLRKTEHWGWAIFSKFPILSSEKTQFTNSRWNGAMISELKISEDTVSLFNIHLQSVHFHKSDYNYIDQLKEEQEAEMRASKKIIFKLKNGFQKRAVQAELISEKIKSSRHTVIVCGDFNDTPGSYAYQKVRGDLQDAFIEKGLGFGQTYTGYFAPFRIDNIFMDKKIKIHSYKIIRKKLSDHFPVVCEFSL